MADEFAYPPDDEFNPIASRRPKPSPFEQHVAEVMADPTNAAAVLDSRAHFSGQQAEQSMRDEVAANAQRPWWSHGTWLPSNDSVASRGLNNLAFALMGAKGAPYGTGRSILPGQPEIPRAIDVRPTSYAGPKGPWEAARPQRIGGQTIGSVVPKDLGPWRAEVNKLQNGDAAQLGSIGLSRAEATKERDPKQSPFDYPMVF